MEGLFSSTASIMYSSTMNSSFQVASETDGLAVEAAKSSKQPLQQSSHTSELESARLDLVDRLQMIGTGSEPELDDIVSLASLICGMPISVIAIVDSERQWFKAVQGLSYRSTSRSVAFCDHTIRQNETLIVEDATKEPRFRDLPAVQDGTICFYAGIPLAPEVGMPVGTLCVMDNRPGKLTDQQHKALHILAQQATTRLELRLKELELAAALKAKQDALLLNEVIRRRFEIFMDSGPMVAFMKDAEGRLLYYNQPFAKHFQFVGDEAIGKRGEDLWPEELARSYRVNDMEVLSTGRLLSIQERSVDKQGTTNIWQSYKFPCSNDAGDLVLGGIAINVTAELEQAQKLKTHTELAQANLLLTELATKDALTGLLLRRVFNDRLESAVLHGHRTKTPLAIMMIDVDNFKQHNDQYGHLHGDAVLRALADAFQEQLRQGDFLARFGGEEFSLGVPNVTLEEASLIAKRLLAAARDTVVDGHSITISIGLAMLAKDMEPLELVARADQVLLAAKRSGKNRVVVWESLANGSGHSAVSLP